MRGSATPTARHFEDYRAAIREVCAKQTVVDGLMAIPHEAQYYGDTLHPNAKGNRRLARAVATALKRIL